MRTIPNQPCAPLYGGTQFASEGLRTCLACTTPLLDSEDGLCESCALFESTEREALNEAAPALYRALRDIVAKGYLRAGPFEDVHPALIEAGREALKLADDGVPVSEGN